MAHEANEILPAVSPDEVEALRGNHPLNIIFFGKARLIVQRTVAKLDISSSPGATDPIPPPTALPNLLSIPLEIRQLIYDYVFQAPVEEERPVSYYTRGTGEWFNLDGYTHCRGAGLSLACSQLYGETRIRYYECAQYYFIDPDDCKLFLDRLGPISHHLGCLYIALEDTCYSMTRLKDILNILLLTSKLHTLRLEIHQPVADGGDLQNYIGEKPLYYPSEKNSNPAKSYDLFLHPSNHPLVKFRSIRTLQVQGNSGMADFEEAIFKLSFNMEDVAREEGKFANRREWHLNHKWDLYFYEMKIEDYLYRYKGPLASNY